MTISFNSGASGPNTTSPLSAFCAEVTGAAEGSDLAAAVSSAAFPQPGSISMGSARIAQIAGVRSLAPNALFWKISCKFLLLSICLSVAAHCGAGYRVDQIEASRVIGPSLVVRLRHVIE